MTAAAASFPTVAWPPVVAHLQRPDGDRTCALCDGLIPAGDECWRFETEWRFAHCECARAVYHG